MTAKKTRDYCAIAADYATRVLDGSQLACKWVKLACQRQRDDLERWKEAGPFVWDPEAASRVCRFIELLTHTKGELAGQRIKLEPWQVFILTTAFGWGRREDGGRRFRRVYIEVARGNGKSCLSSGVALYCLVADNEPGAEVYSFATTRDQAKIVFGDAKRMAETIEKIDFEGIASAVLTVADYAIRAFNAVGGFNTVLYAMGAIMAGKTLMSVIALGSSIISMVQTFGTLVTAARTAAVAIAGAFGPVGLVLTAVAAIAGVVIANWDRIWPALKAGASAAADFIGAVWDTVVPKFQAVFGSLLSIAKAFFQGDISGLLSGFDDLFQAAFNLLPDKWAKACLDWYTGVTESLRNVGRMISDYFTNFDFKSLLPDWVSDLFGGSKTSGDGKQMQSPQVTPEARLSGRMNISVTASGGASAAVSDVSGSPGLDIYGQVGRSDRFVGAD